MDEGGTWSIQPLTDGQVRILFLAAGFQRDVPSEVADQLAHQLRRAARTARKTHAARLSAQP